MKKLLIPFVVLSALLALGAGAWLAASTTPKATTNTATQTSPTTSSTTTSSTDAYLAVANTSDFTPPTGRTSAAKPFTAGVRRIMTATSSDGIHFTPTGNILSDRANVPDLHVADDGSIWMYYIGQDIETGKEESTVLATSSDNGKTWAYHYLTFNNFPNDRDPSDPDVVRLADGTYRMFFTMSFTAEKLGIGYADSTDGLSFSYKGESFEGPLDAVDSNTVYFDGVWHMFVGQEQNPGQVHATSTDGITFTIAADRSPVFPGKNYYSSDELVENNALRLYAFSGDEKNARSFTTTDGITWTPDDIALTADDATTMGTEFLQDVSVVKLPDGTYFMAYVTELPTAE